VEVAELADAAAFLAAASPLLLADEPRHNLMLGLAATLRDHPALYPERHTWLVRGGDAVVAAALWTPPYNLVVSRAVPAALAVLAGAIDGRLPGVTGALPEAERFAAAWSARTGATVRRAMSQAIHAATRVVPPPRPQGALRDATAADRPLVVEWWRAFAMEAHAALVAVDAEAAVDHRLAAPDAGVVLWDDGGPVSLAAFGGPTPNGIRLGPVYTPPEARGRGYASALVAGLSEELLAGGRRFCFLYTDLANPTANRMYARLGYERVCDSVELAFE
jgi:predicted GNAT family acetyltransferase